MAEGRFRRHRGWQWIQSMEASLVELQRQVDTLEQNKLETTTCSQPQQCLRAVEAVEQLVQSIGEELREEQRRCEELASQLEEVSPEQYFLC